MSRDIRSFFKPIPSKNNTKEQPQKDLTQKNRPFQILSSDEEYIESTPEAIKKPTVRKRKKHAISSSDDSEDENVAKSVSKKSATHRRPIKQNLKPANAIDILGNAPVKQAKVEKIKMNPATENIKSKETKPKKNKSHKKSAELGVHRDEDFEKTLLDLDDDLLVTNDDIINESINEALANTPKTLNETFAKKSETTSDHEGNNPKTPKSKGKTNYTNKTPGKSTTDDFSNPRKKSKANDTSSSETDRERFEKRQQSAILYQKYKNRGAPAHHGCKKLPQGKPDCLKNLCFIKTGVLDSLESEEFEDLVKKFGGRTVKAVSKKVNYMVVGEEPGPAKLEKAKALGIPTVTEDEFLDIICTKSGMKPTYANNGVHDDESHINDQKEEKSPSARPQKSPDIKKKTENHLKTTQNECMNIDIKITNEIPQETIKTPSSTDKIAFGTTVNYKKHTDLKSIKKTPVEIPKVNISWTDKYTPVNTKSIIGQQGEKSCLKKLMNWLKNWHKNNSKSMKSKISKPSIWSKDNDGAYFKCALLSGPPGVGKTTTATLVAKELDFDIVEFNASDTRNKKSLHEEVAQLLSTTSLSGYVKDGSVTTSKRVLLMDEVDGMAGNEDRGGIQELINLIKNTSVPIICMCNDRYHQKIRSLVNYCFDLRFTKPRLEQIRGAMMSVCFKEGLKISPEALTQIISGTGMDIRQTLNHLSIWTSVQKTISPEEAQEKANSAKKDIVIGPWEVCRAVFSEEDNKKMSLSEKFHLFFYDYNICPLFIQENYLQVVPHVPKEKLLERIANTVDSISMGDIVGSKIRGSNNWSLLETQGLFSCVLPGHYMSGHIGGQINFPSWLGKNSAKGKRQRLLSEIHSHTRLCTSGSKLAINLDYASHLYRHIIGPLIEFGGDGVGDAINAMKSYNLLREDLDSLNEITKWSKTESEDLDPKIDYNDLFVKIDSKVKASFTREYNKNRPAFPYAITQAATKKKSIHTLSQEGECIQDDEVESSIEEEDDDDINNDEMIKRKPLAKIKNKKEKSSAGDASTSNNNKKKIVSKRRDKKLP